MDLHKVLNKEQFEAVDTVNGPVLVFAGAGSGKTRVITYRIYNLIINHNINPKHILAVTFTNKAADEMKKRVFELTGNSFRLDVSTFHSFGLKLLRYYGKEIGIKPNFAIYDEKDQLQLIKDILKKLDVDIKKYNPKSYQHKINRYKDNFILPDNLNPNSTELSLPYELEIYKEYEKQKQQNRALDFADLICQPVRLLQKKCSTAEYIKNKYKYILVDEFQDTNKTQFKLLQLLSEIHKNICVVGDDDQSIYSWRGALIKNILNFEKYFPGTRTIKLVKNYRSTQPILDISNLIVKNNKYRSEKKLVTDRKFGVPPSIKMVSNEFEEAKFVAKKINEMVDSGNYTFNDFAVFYRTNFQSRLFEEKFREFSIPYLIFGTLSFYSRKEIKDITAYLKFFVNPDDDISLLRIINTPKRGIGDTTVNKLKDFAAFKGYNLYKIIENIEKLNFLGSGTINKIVEFRKLVSYFINKIQEDTVDNILKDLIDKLDIIQQYESSDDIKEKSRAENVKELVNSACEFVKSGNENNLVSDFLEKITMFNETDKIDDTQNYVSLMTYHCAKGLEFKVVFMVGVEEEILPHYNSLQDENAIEEERRLCYVGITRAKDIIYLLHTFNRRKFGMEYNPLVSRFITEAYPDYSPVIESSNFDLSYKRKNSFYKPKLSAQKNTGFKKPKTIKPGSKILHKKFGPGKVLKVTKNEIKIGFPKFGVKLFAPEYLKVKIL